MSQSVLFHVETIQQNSVKAWILNNWTTREDHLKRFLKKNPGGSLKTKEKQIQPFQQSSILYFKVQRTFRITEISQSYNSKN